MLNAPNSFSIQRADIEEKEFNLIFRYEINCIIFPTSEFLHNTTHKNVFRLVCLLILLKLTQNETIKVVIVG